jgi:V8-like Glu-specific endopeptidase
VTVAGCPFAGFSGETHVVGSGAVDAFEGPLLFYDIDTEDGQSGAPVLVGQEPFSPPAVQNGPICRRPRLGGILNYYERLAA